MKLIESKAEIIPQGEGLLGVYKQIEVAGRTCYKSEDKITNNSCVEFVNRMINSGHTAMLEHGTVYLKVPGTDWMRDAHEWIFMFPDSLPWIYLDSTSDYVFITTNLRHILEGEVGLDVVKEYWSEPTQFHERRVTVRFTCDRGVSHELVRHRVFSFAQESTRYCNYSKDKFGSQLSFIIPSWMNLNEGEYKRELTNNGLEITGDGYFYDSKDGFDDESLFIYHLLTCEHRYLSLLDMGWKPQQARQILPNALKTEVVMTGFVSDWEHFFELRCAANAHPDMQVLAKDLYRQFEEKGLI